MRHPSPQRPAGEDPRVSRSRAAIIRAATDLLVDGGPNAVTIDAIVARSGVAKSTIYRHWESRDEVLLAVMESCAPVLDPPDPALSVADSLRRLGHTIAAYFNDPEWARVLPALLLLKSHAHGVAALEERLERDQQQVITQLIERGVQEGMLRPDAADHEAMTQLVGPIMFAHLTGTVAVDEAFVDRTVDRFLATYRPAD